jgi:hypothetical protein
MRTFLRTLLLLFILVPLAAGCSGGSDGQAPDGKKGGDPPKKKPKGTVNPA